jgi:hypothetical protein
MWLPPVLSMKLVDQLRGMFKVVRRFLTCVYVVVSGPLDEVVELPITQFGVENAVDFPCFLSRILDNCR